MEISPIEEDADGQENILITELTVHNAPNIFNDGTKYYNLLFSSRNASDFENLIEEFHSAAEDFKEQQIRFLYINTDLDDNQLFLKLFEIDKKDLPAIRLFEIEENKELLDNVVDTVQRHVEEYQSTNQKHEEGPKLEL